MRLPALRLLLHIGAEHLIRELFLLVGHPVVQIFESLAEFLNMLRMFFGKLLVRLHVLHRVDGFELLNALHYGLIHVARILAHHFGELAPLSLLGRGDVQLGVQLLDAALDPLFRSFAGDRVPS